MPTSTATEQVVTATSISVTRPEEGGRVSVVHRALGGPDRPVIRPVVLTSDTDGARVSLVPEGALLLAGDVVRLDIEVGPGATLELMEPAGTVAYDMRGGSASWDVHIHIASAGRLVWHGEPFVVASGAVVRRHTTVTLGQSARLALRETLVLGRHDETGGRVDQRLEVVTEGGQPLLVDALDTTGHPLAWGDHRAMTSVLMLGADLEETVGGTRFELEAGGMLVRSLTGEAHTAELRSPWQAAVAATLRKASP
ncbi:urease accessory protein UreD [Nocardioides sp. Kera G14]|uniref:urease accessory protein UreD n=1 Tax=Nocardioides sp. Kera G14 TaxID=2884264 RepID=UPI001D0F7148|nr:urease accessory protein UreD [Nocardioides sp. Kera G14]UDY25208.1 urease accessory protein UreD [Nocardioides sp. Kera G14]